MTRVGRKGLRRVVAALFALLLAAPHPSHAAYEPLEELPVESALYLDLENVATSYGFGRAFLSTRPWDRADLAAYLDTLAHVSPESRRDPACIRLQRLLALAGDPRGRAPLVRAADDAGARLEISPYLRAAYAEDRARRAVTRDIRTGLSGAATLGPPLLIAADAYAGTFSRGAHGNPANSRRFAVIERVDYNSYFDRAMLVARGGGMRARLAHTWLRWGPGFSGPLALSDGAPALDLIELRARLAGRAQFTWFVATLDPLTEAYLAGHRLELRPAASVDVGLAELARFDGGGSAPLYLVPLVPYSLIEKRLADFSQVPADSQDQRLVKNNVMWSADFAWRARPGARVYGELLVDDVSFSSTWRPRSMGWQTGAQLRARRGAGAVGARFEYTRVYRYTYSVWHRHDFQYGGLPLGFPLGPDVENAVGQLEWERGPDWSIRVTGTLANKGEGRLGFPWYPDSGRVASVPLLGVVEHRTSGAIDLSYGPSSALDAGITLGWEAIENLEHRSGVARSRPFGTLRLAVRW